MKSTYVDMFRTARETTLYASNDSLLVQVTLAVSSNEGDVIDLKNAALLNAAGERVFCLDVHYAHGNDVLALMGLRRPFKLQIARGESMSRRLIFRVRRGFNPQTLAIPAPGGEVQLPVDPGMEPLERALPETAPQLPPPPPGTMNSFPLSPLRIGPEHFLSLRPGAAVTTAGADRYLRSITFLSVYPREEKRLHSAVQMSYRYRMLYMDLEAAGGRFHQEGWYAAGSPGWFRSRTRTFEARSNADWSIVTAGPFSFAPRLSTIQRTSRFSHSLRHSEEARVIEGRTSGTGIGGGIAAVFETGPWNLRLAFARVSVQSAMFYRELWFRESTRGLIYTIGTADVAALNQNSEKLNTLRDRQDTAALNVDYMLSDFVGISLGGRASRSKISFRNYAPRAYPLLRNNQLEDVAAVYWLNRAALNRSSKSGGWGLTAGITVTEAWKSQRVR